MFDNCSHLIDIEAHLVILVEVRVFDHEVGCCDRYREVYLHFILVRREIDRLSQLPYADPE